MANEKHQITLAAKDAISPVLQKVGREATQAGQKAEQAAEKASRATQDWSKAGKALGAGLATIGIASVKLAGDQQRLEIALRRTYGEGADRLREFADEIQRTTVFSNDQAEQAAVTAGTLARNYNFTAEQIEKLIQVSADLAAVNGLELSDAMERVTSAMRGEAESSELLGLTLNDHALGLDKMSASTTDAEKAQIRFNALLDQSSFATGAAAEQANLASQSWRKYANTIQDQLQGLGGTLEDYQGVILSLSAAGAALGPLGDVFEAIDGKAKLARASSLALGLALSPAGLAVGALGAAAGITYLINQMNRYDDAAEQAARSTLDLENFFKSLASSLDPVNKRILTDLYGNLDQIIDDAAQRQSDLDKLITLQLGITNAGIDISTDQAAKLAAETTGLTVEQLKWIDSNGDLSVTIDEVNQKVALFQQNLDRLNADQVKEVQANIQSLFSKSNLDYQKAAAAVSDLNRQLDAGLLTPEQYVQAIADLAANYGDYLRGMSGDTEDFAIKVRRSWGGITLDMQGGIQETLSSFDDWKDGLLGTGHAVEDVTDQIAAQKAAHDELVGSFDGLDRSTTTASRDFQDLTGWMGDTADASAALDDQIASLSDTIANITPASVLDSTFGAIVGYTNDIVGSIDKVKEWSDALMAPLGTDFQDNGSMSTMLDLLQRGKIDAEDYNEALDAQTRIYEDLNRAQDASAAIQIKQSNYIADATDATADYLETLAALPEAQQAEALAYADADLTGRAEDIRQLSTEYGDMSEAQQDAFAKTVTSAAAVDPMLALILEDMGLIKKSATDPTGWTINTDTVDAESDMDRLTTAIDNLIATLAQAYNLNVTTSVDTSAVDNLPNPIAYRTISVTPRIGLLENALGGVSPWPDTAALGRVSAGNATLVGENGPEIVNLPGGALVTPNHASRYMTPKGGGQTIHIENLNVSTPNPQAFLQFMRQYASSMERR